MASKAEIEKLRKIINDDRTSPEEKIRFQAILDKIENKNTTPPVVEPVPEVAVVEKDDSVLLEAPEQIKEVKVKKPRKKRSPNKNPAKKAPKTVVPDCDELVSKYKQDKVARLKRQAKRKTDHRKPDTKLRDQIDKKLTEMLNNVIKLSKKRKLSPQVKKDVLSILKSGITHVKKA